MLIAAVLASNAAVFALETNEKYRKTTGKKVEDEYIVVLDNQMLRSKNFNAAELASDQRRPSVSSTRPVERT